MLLGYKIRYQAVAVGEEPVEDQPIIEERVAASSLSFVLKNLEIFTLYRVDVVGYTIKGDGPPATDFAGLASIIDFNLLSALKNDILKPTVEAVFNCVSEVISLLFNFCLATLCDWLQILAPLY